MAGLMKYCETCNQFHEEGKCKGEPKKLTKYKKKSPQQLDTLRKILEGKFDDKCTGIKDTEKAYVFKFECRRPHVMPKETV